MSQAMSSRESQGTPITSFLSRDMTPIYLPIKVSIVEQLLCNGCVAAHSSLTFGPNLAISVRSVP